MQIELDMSKLERGTHTGQVKVTRGGKTFYRKQRLGTKEKEKKPGDVKNLLISSRKRVVISLELPR